MRAPLPPAQLVAILLLALASRLPLSAAGPACVPTTMEHRTTAAARAKFGYEQFLPNPLLITGPVRLYLRQTVREDFHYAGNNGESAEYHSTVRTTFDRSTATPGGPSRFGCSRWHAQTQSESEGEASHTVNTSTCRTTQLPNGAWTDPACWNRVATAPRCPFGITSQTPTSLIEEGHETSPDRTLHFRRETTLEQEYTTADLRQDLLRDLPDYPPAWNPGSAQASFQLSGFQGCGLAHKMAYRFKFRGDRDVTYRIQWDEVTFQIDGQQSLRHCEELVEGAGGDTFSSEYECLPPPWNGGDGDGSAYTVIANLETTIEPELPADTAPGAGGPALGDLQGAAPGCVGCGPNSNRGFAGVDLGFSLGRATGGQPAGWLRLWASLPDATLGSPAALRFNAARSDVEVIPMGDELRQVRAPQALADIVPLNAHSYEIRFYLVPSQGFPKQGPLYAVSGTPLVTWRIQSGLDPNLDPTHFPEATPALVVTELRPGGTRTWVYHFSIPLQLWTLQYPGNLRLDYGQRTLEQGRFVERLVVKPSSTRPETHQVERHYAVHPSGHLVLAAETVGAGPDARTTHYTYYPQGIFNGTLQPLQAILPPDRPWQRFSYDPLGRLLERVSQLGDAPPDAPADQNRVARFDYSPAAVPNSGDDGSIEPLTPRRIDEYLKGIPVATRYTVLLPGERRDIHCPTPGNEWNHPSNLVTVTRYFLSGPHQGAIQSLQRPDGTLTLHTFSSSPGGAQHAHTVKTGQPNPAGNEIVAGTLTTTVTGPLGQPLARTQQDVATGKTLAQELYADHDELHRPRSLTHLDGSREESHYSCCGLQATVDRDGVLTEYHYDDLRRLTATTRLHLTTTNLLDPVGRVLATLRLPIGLPPIIQRQACYDTAGRLVAETNALGGVTRMVETRDAGGRLVRTTTDPQGGTRIESHFLDGSLRTLTGTAVFPVRYDYGIELDPNSPGFQLPYTRETKLNASGAETPEWIMTYSDSLGRLIHTIYPDRTPASLADNPVHQTSYHANGQVSRERDPDGVTTLFAYAPGGDLTLTALDLNQNNQIDLAGVDRVSRLLTDVTSLDGVDVTRSRRYVWNQPQTDAPTLVATLETSTDGRTTWDRLHEGALTLTTRTDHARPEAGIMTTTTTHPDGSTVHHRYESGRLTLVARRDAQGTSLGQTTYLYDPHGRIWKVTDARSGTTTLSYNAADQIIAVASPPPGDGHGPQVTHIQYDLSGRATRVAHPDGTVSSNLFLPTGLLQITLGSRTYPVQYGYDAQGRMTTMTTWRSASTGAGAATTTWTYDPRRGWPTRKIHAGETDASDDFDYTPAGRLARRSWERGVTTSYAYNAGGDLVSVDYSDATPDLSLTYSRQGRRQTVTQGPATTTLTYGHQGLLSGEAYTGGGLHGLTVSVGWDSLLRRTNVSVNTSQPLHQGFAYDQASRLRLAWQGVASAHYQYLPHSSLVGTVTFQHQTTPRLTTLREFDALERLTSIRSFPTAPGARPVAFDYTYDTANQRIRAGTADGSAWQFEYDELGQVTAGRRLWPDGQPVPGQQFHYLFDHIGNRIHTRSGGDAQGNVARWSTYEHNALNQISRRTVPNSFDVLGLAHPQATVTVNGSPADYRRGEYFQESVSANNDPGPAWPSLQVLATQGPASQAWPAGHLFVGPAQENFVYDADGNLTRDGRWTYAWDAENRLARMVTHTAVGPARRIDFHYDWRGRRVAKRVWDNTTGGGAPVSDVLFLYDHWNLLAELNATNRTVLRSYLRGLDLSGSTHGAGGVGGLLFVFPPQRSPQAVAYDGNGNVAALVDLSTGAPSAHYEHGPFGEPIRASGPEAASNPFRFSSKYHDAETSLVYYGYRAAHPAPGRWLARPPRRAHPDTKP